MVCSNKKWRTEAEEAFADWEGEFECSLAKPNGVGTDIYLAGVESRESTGWSRERRRSVHDYVKILDDFARCLFERADSYPSILVGCKTLAFRPNVKEVFIAKVFFQKLLCREKSDFLCSAKR